MSMSNKKKQKQVIEESKYRTRSPNSKEQIHYYGHNAKYNSHITLYVQSLKHCYYVEVSKVPDAWAANTSTMSYRNKYKNCWKIQLTYAFPEI